MKIYIYYDHICDIQVWSKEEMELELLGSAIVKRTSLPISEDVQPNNELPIINEVGRINEMGHNWKIVSL